MSVRRKTAVTSALQRESGRLLPVHDLDVDGILKLFDHLPRVYLFVKNLEHRFIRVNRGFLALHGCRSEADAIGRTDFDFHPPVLATQYVEEDRRVMETGQTVEAQAWLVQGADGMPRWYLSTKIPLYDRRGRINGLAGVLLPYDHASAGDLPGEYRRLTATCEHVLANYASPITVADLAEKANLSVSQLQREFRKLFGMTPTDYLQRVRLLMARRSLEHSSQPIGQIALACGFYDQSHFTRAFRAATGLQPLAYRRRFTPRPPAVGRVEFTDKPKKQEPRL